MWERRYGFPAPARDAHGERLYPAEQVQRLRLVKRLMDQGFRPGRLLAAPVGGTGGAGRMAGRRDDGRAGGSRPRRRPRGAHGGAPTSWTDLLALVQAA